VSKVVNYSCAVAGRPPELASCSYALTPPLKLTGSCSCAGSHPSVYGS